MWADNTVISLAIVDDHPIVIEGIRSLLAGRSDIVITGGFTNGEALLHFLAENDVRIVLLDIMLPDINGMELCKKIREIAPETLVLALSNHAERSIVLQTLQNGASGYLLKNASVEELIGCIQAALSGEITFSREIREIIALPSRFELRSIPQLTKREKQILALIAEGHTSSAIAEQLFLSPLTIETHRRNLLQKFSVKNAAELIRMAVQLQLV